MTPRERMIATLHHQKPDRIPIQFTLCDELMERVKRHYRVETGLEVERILDADIEREVGVTTLWPDYEKRTNGELNGPFGRVGRTVLRDARTFEDRWGVVQRVGDDRNYLQWVGGPFVNTDDLDAFNWPGADRIVDDPDLPSRVRKLKDEGYWVCGSGGVHPFKHAWRMRGFENFLCDYIANPEWVEAIYDRIVRYNLEHCRRAAAAGVDAIQYWGDVAMQDRMIVPPDRWRALDKPVWQRLIAETRKVNASTEERKQEAADAFVFESFDKNAEADGQSLRKSYVRK